MSDVIPFPARAETRREKRYRFFCTHCKTDWTTEYDRGSGPCPCCDHESVREIMVHFVWPAIPIRDFDYCAWFDGEEERGDYGYGHDAVTAVNDLINNYGDA